MHDTSKPDVTVTSNVSVCPFRTMTQSANQKIVCLVYRRRFQSGWGYPSWCSRNQSECTDGTCHVRL